MDRKTIQDATFPNCPIRNILSRIGDKWAMLVLYTLEQHGTLRFNDIYRCIPDVSQKMLTATLLPHLDSLISWAIENFDDIISIRANSN